MKPYVCVLSFGVFILPKIAFCQKMQAEISSALVKTTGSQNGSQIVVNRMDLITGYRSGKGTVHIRLNLRDPYADPVNTNDANLKFEDAWMSYEYSPKAVFKIGYEDAFWKYDGRNSEIWAGNRLDRAEKFAKIGVNGQIDHALSYGVLLWGQGGESGLTDNAALQVNYQINPLSAGLIYRIQKDGLVKKSGSALYGSYVSGKFGFYLKLAQLLKESSASGGNLTVIGGNYVIDTDYSVGFAYSQLTEVNDTIEKSFLDIILLKKLNAQIKGFMQYVSGDAGNNNSTTLLAFGAKAEL